MRKVTSRRKAWLVKHQQKEFKRRLRGRYRLKLRRSGAGRRLASIYEKGQVRKEWIALRGKPMPEVFCLDRNFAEVANFLARMRENTLAGYRENQHKFIKRRRRRVSWFDFASIKSISPAAALLLAAEFDRGRRLFGQRMYAIDMENWNPQVVAVLQQLGLLALLDVEDPTPMHQTKDGATVILPFRTGDKVEGPEILGLIKNLGDVVPFIGEESNIKKSENDDENDYFDKSDQIYHILIEAMNNVIEHAYRETIDSKIVGVRNWWMTAAVNRARRKLTIVMFDQGITIPKSLPRWERYDRVQAILERLRRRLSIGDAEIDDGLVLKAAMKVAVSSTEEKHRGKGFGRMKNFVEECRSGRLRVISRFGSYVYEKGRRAIHVTNSVPIFGTLVEWEVTL